MTTKVRASSEAADGEMRSDMRARAASEVSAFIETRCGAFAELADKIWALAELRWSEYESAAVLAAMAERAGFRVTRGLAGVPTAFVAEAGSGGPVIGIPGEYDALAGLSQQAGCSERRPDPARPTGNGHGCGHHLLGAGALLAALAAARYLAQHRLPGTIRFYGCPAEEAAAGKTFLVKAGAFDDVDAVLAWHPGTTTAVMRRRTLAYCQVHYRFTGVAAHAGASPHLGRSALDAVELMNVGVNFLREHMPPTARVHYAITDAGGASPNVVPATAAAYYIVRTTTVREMRALHERVRKIAEGAALMTEVSLDVEYDGGCSEVLPNDTLEAALADNLRIFGPVPFGASDQQLARQFSTTYEDQAADGALRDDLELFAPGDERPVVGYSTDLGDVSWVVPTASISAACDALGTPEHSWQRVAQGTLPAAHKGMTHAAKVLAATAVEIAYDPALLARAKAEFDERVSRTPYDPPIPADLAPPPLRIG